VPTLSLRWRLILLVAGAMLPLVMLSGIAILQSYRAAQANATDRILQTTRGAMSSVDRELQNLISGVEVLALSPALAAGDFEAFRSEADRFSARFAGGDLVGVADRSGQFLFVTTMPAGSKLPQRGKMAPLEAVYARPQPFISDLFMGTIIGRMVFTSDVPVIVDGKVKYDLTFSPPRETFDSILAHLALPPGWIVEILDRSNQHIARVPAFGESNRIVTAPPWLQDEMAKSPEGILRATSFEGTPLLTAYTTSPDFGWKVAIGMPADALSDAPRRAFIITMAASAALLAVALAFASHLAGEIVRAEANRELLINELNHRVKNTLSAVQAIVSRTLRVSPSENARAAIENRLSALSHAHNILSSRSWESASITDIVQGVVDPHTDGRMTARGPQLRLSPRAAIAVAMILNELATNAVKYGALATQGGMIHLLWSVMGERRLHLEWRESADKPISVPTRTGYGTDFIHRAVTHELGGQVTIEYRPEGLFCAIEFPLA
jgi:two-component sensor histidine kinase